MLPSRRPPTAWCSLSMRSCAKRGRSVFLSLNPRSHGPLEAVKVVADGHGEREQLLQSLLRPVKLDGDAAGLEVDTRRQVRKFLVHDCGRSFHDELGTFDPFPPQ